jgi:hypothetical protein
MPIDRSSLGPGRFGNELPCPIGTPTSVARDAGGSRMGRLICRPNRWYAMSRTELLRPSRRDARVLAWLAWGIAALGTIKYLALAIEGGVARSPWGFALILVLPFVLGAVALTSHRRLGAVVVGLFAALLVFLCGVAVSEGISLDTYWPDLLVILIGGPTALIAVGLSVRVFAEH